MGLCGNDNVQTTKCPSVGLIKMFQTCTSQCMLDFPMVFRLFFTETLDHMRMIKEIPSTRPLEEKKQKNAMSERSGS